MDHLQWVSNAFPFFDEFQLRRCEGATDSSLYTGDIDYNDVPNGQESYWLQKLSSLTVQGSTISLNTTDSGSYAAIDTGTTLIGGPADQIAQIYAQIPNSVPGGADYQGYYLYREQFTNYLPTFEDLYCPYSLRYERRCYCVIRWQDLVYQQ